MQALTVSIVTYHTAIDELDKCLECLTSDKIAHIYIIDNGAEQRLQSWAEGKPKLSYHPADNPGFGAAHNIAIRMAAKEGAAYHLVMNSDVAFDPDIIDRIYDFMQSDGTVGMVQPRILYPDGSQQYTCRRLPTTLDVFGRRFLPQSLFSKRNDKYLLKSLDMSVTHNIPYHQGSFMFIRMSALQEAGLFDERFFMYPEDIDLTRRIHRRYKTLYFPMCEIIHYHRAESYKNLRMTKIHIINMIRYFNKWGWWFDAERRKFNRRIR